MEHWTNDVWSAIAAAFVIGFIIGYALLRMTKGNVQKNIQLEAELKQASAKIDEQKQQLEQHFSQSATLLTTLAEDYKKLYDHLAKSSETLLPDVDKSAYFSQPALLKPDAEPQNKDNPPRDYSEGSSGLLKS